MSRRSRSDDSRSRRSSGTGGVAVSGTCEIKDLDLCHASSRTELEIPLKTDSFMCAESSANGESSKPIEGAGVCLSSPGSVGGVLHFVQTDATGALRSPRASRIHLLSLIFPSRRLSQTGPWRRDDDRRDRRADARPVRAGSRGDATRGRRRRGRKAVAGARYGKWDRIYPANSPNDPRNGDGSNFSAVAKTDAQGQFMLEGIHPGANVTLEASAFEERAPTGRTIGGRRSGTRSGSSSAGPIPSALSDGWSTRPINRSPVLWSRFVLGPLTENGSPDADPVRFAESEIRTDGRRADSGLLDRSNAAMVYRAEIKAPNETFMPENTPWLALKTGTRPFFPTDRAAPAAHGPRPSGRSPAASRSRASVRQAGDGPAPTETDHGL